MSLKFHEDAYLAGFEGPYHNDILVELTRALDFESLTHGDVKRIGDIAGVYASFISPITSDGYEWFAVVTSPTKDDNPKGCTIVLAVPQYRDRFCEDGCYADRCVAAYAVGIPECDIEGFLERMLKFVLVNLAAR